MIKNVIFDIGNVILAFNRDYLLSHFYTGKDYDLVKEKIFYNWEELDEDLISLEKYDERVKASLPEKYHGVAMAVLHNWEYYMSYKPGIVDLIRELKNKGYKLYVLSNMTRHFIKNAYKFPIFKEFDGIVYSAPIGLIKPNAEIFNYLLDKYQLIADECLFIDDLKDNVIAADKLNIKTYHYQSDTNELRKYILPL